MLLFFTLISNAQVQRTFYGVPFGASIEQAKMLLSKQGVRFSQGNNSYGIKNDSVINIYSVRIGNYSVDKAVMNFSKDGFYNIRFQKEFDYPYLSKGDDFFDSLHRDLSRKYSILDKHIDKGYLTNTILIYGLNSDKRTRIMLQFMRAPSLKSGYLSLDYYENSQDMKRLFIGESNNEL